MAARPTSDDSPRFIARQMAFGFGAVSVVAVGMCAMLLSIIYDVSGLVESMRHDETSIRQGLSLATSVRELSIHIAHTVIEADDSHLDHYGDFRDRVRTQIQQLSSRVPAEERVRLEALGEKTQRMHHLLMESALPAAQRGDLEEVRKVHREIEALGEEAAEHADALAHVTTSQMAHAHVLATNSTRLGLLGGGLCAALIVILSIGFTLRLRAAVLKPLLSLTQAARRFGSGNFEERVGRVGRGELAALGDAFDHMADELARREARLVQSERMAAIGQLAAGVAHELNNPIGIIRGYLKTMSPEEDSETLRDELAILDEEAGHCQRIADDLLSYARTGELSIDRVHMAEFLQETTKRFQSGNGSTGTRVEVSAQDVIVEADGARLRQVVLNLLANADQASPPNAVVLLRGQLVGAQYQIEVEDTGPGVAREDRAHIFEPFFSKRRGGSGLGLAVCQGIVRAHGGTIDVVEKPAPGTIFRVCLPEKHARTSRPSRPVEARGEER
ncbi:MAG: HAMP domain-containing protein [Deltaproteobacteria bacterium]|nr:HAMP domain-containing protein [Deltaproteobacteria bacterium]